MISRFKALHPDKFTGTTEPTKAEQWIQQMEDIFEVLGCTDREKRRMAVFQLTIEARNWWEMVKTTVGEGPVQQMTWTIFKDKFLEKCFPDTERERREKEFIELTQGTMSVLEYHNQFEALSRFAPRLIDTPERQTRKFVKGLIPPIRRMIVGRRHQTYEEVVEEALALEEDNQEFRKQMEGKNHEKNVKQGNKFWKGGSAQKKLKINPGNTNAASFQCQP